MFKDKEAYFIAFMIVIIVILLYKQIVWSEKEKCLNVKCVIEEYLEKSEKLDECRLKKRNCAIEVQEYKVSMWEMDKALLLNN
tara:strand:+ start:37 stop:285 length:249 start_codon:yes stop_codon:yes gene_type:complete